MITASSVTLVDELRIAGKVPGPVGIGSSSMPSVMLGMLEALDVRADHRVLEIGTGYNTALLAQRAAEVTTVEIDPTLAEHGWRPEPGILAPLVITSLLKRLRLGPLRGS